MIMKTLKELLKQRLEEKGEDILVFPIYNEERKEIRFKIRSKQYSSITFTIGNRRRDEFQFYLSVLFNVPYSYSAEVKMVRTSEMDSFQKEAAGPWVSWIQAQIKEWLKENPGTKMQTLFQEPSYMYSIMQWEKY